MTTQARIESIESQIRAKRADQLRVSEFIPARMQAQMGEPAVSIRRTQIIAAGGRIISRIPLEHEPEPRPCDHHWEWIDNRTVQCHRCGAITSDDSNTR